MIRPCLRTKWHINPFSRLATTDMGRKLGEELGPRLTQCRRVEAYLHIPSGILVYPTVWPQQTWAENWGTVPLFGGAGVGAHLTQCRLGRGIPPYQVAS